MAPNSPDWQDDTETGTVYLLCFNGVIGNPDSKRGYAKHYLGWAKNLNARIIAHRTGNSYARLMLACFRKGITFEVVRTWEGATRSRERQIKRQGSLARHCPRCGLRPGRALIERTVRSRGAAHS